MTRLVSATKVTKWLTFLRWISPDLADNMQQECCDVIGLGPFALLMPIVGHLGCGLSCESPSYEHTGDVYELQVAPEGSQGSQRETAEELLRG